MPRKRNRETSDDENGELVIVVDNTTGNKNSKKGGGGGSKRGGRKAASSASVVVIDDDSSIERNEGKKVRSTSKGAGKQRQESGSQPTQKKETSSIFNALRKEDKKATAGVVEQDKQQEKEERSVLVDVRGDYSSRLLLCRPQLYEKWGLGVNKDMTVANIYDAAKRAGISHLSKIVAINAIPVNSVTEAVKALSLPLLEKKSRKNFIEEVATRSSTTLSSTAGRDGSSKEKAAGSSTTVGPGEEEQEETLVVASVQFVEQSQYQKSRTAAAGKKTTLSNLAAKDSKPASKKDKLEAFKERVSELELVIAISGDRRSSGSGGSQSTVPEVKTNPKTTKGSRSRKQEAENSVGSENVLTTFSAGGSTRTLLQKEAIKELLSHLEANESEFMGTNKKFFSALRSRYE